MLTRSTVRRDGRPRRSGSMNRERRGTVVPEITDPRAAAVLAEMDAEIEAAIQRAFMRLDELSDEPTASPSPDEPSLPLSD